MISDVSSETRNALSARTRETYDRCAAVYDRDRGRSLFEKAWLDRDLQGAAPGARVLDLGCGAGAPIGEYLVARGFDVTGADFAPATLALYAERLPAARVIDADMRALDLPDSYEAIIGWGSFFHLTPPEQEAALPRIAGHLAPGGRLLLTVGPDAGETTGRVAIETVYHASLSIADYRALLAGTDTEVEAFVPDDSQAQGHSMLLACKGVPDSRVP